MSNLAFEAPWPAHFYLIGGSGQQAPAAAPSREVMGAKAYNLLRMAQLGLPVPPALAIGTPYTCAPETALAPTFQLGVPALERATGRIFGDARRPLIVSVRSGAAVSMPGMMETLLNIGLAEHTLPGVLRQTGNPRLVWDAYRRLVASYGEVVAGLPAALFEAEVERATAGGDERRLDFFELRGLTRRFLDIYRDAVGEGFPQDVCEQLGGAVRAVFASWAAEKAREYRRINGIDENLGTAVTIQTMVFGNSGGHSGAGVGFTRDPTTGERQLWVDFLANAQGEDVVSGRRNAHGHELLAALVPQAWTGLQAAAQAIERAFGDMQDFEFTVQEGALYLLQTRTGKRTPLAAARIALDLLDEGVIETAAALERTHRLREADLGSVRLAVDGAEPAAALARAMPACPGVVSGAIAFDAGHARVRSAAGETVILVRQDAETSDIGALQLAAGLLTRRGARTSHAAVVARQLGKVCLVGCEELRIDFESRTLYFGDRALAEGDIITLDGNDGAIYAGTVAATQVIDEPLLRRLRTLREIGGGNQAGA